MYRKRADGAGSEEPVVATAAATPSDWSRDGQFLTYTSDGDLWVVPMRGDLKPTRYMQTPATDTAATTYSSDRPITTPSAVRVERVLFERICATAIFQLSLSSYKKRFISKPQHRLAGDLPPASS